MSEAFTAADMMGVVLLGMGLVFAVLLIIYAMMVAMRLIFYHPEKPAQAAPVQAPVTEIKKNEVSEDEEAAAVIAVIAASMGKSPSSFRLTNLYRK